MHFYELHEGDDDLYSDLLLARETEMEPDVFFDIVQTIRRRVQDSFTHDTLVEAIGEELEREYDFIVISDDRLVAAINVSKKERDNFLSEILPEDDDDRLDGPQLRGGGGGVDAEADDDNDDDEEDEDEDEEEDEDEPKGDLRSLYVDLDPNPNLPRPN